MRDLSTLLLAALCVGVWADGAVRFGAVSDDHSTKASDDHSSKASDDHKSSDAVVVNAASSDTKANDAVSPRFFLGNSGGSSNGGLLGGLLGIFGGRGSGVESAARHQNGYYPGRPGGYYPGGNRPGGYYPGSPGVYPGGRPGGYPGSRPGGYYPGNRPGGYYPGGSYPGSGYRPTYPGPGYHRPSSNCKNWCPLYGNGYPQCCDNTPPQVQKKVCPAGSPCLRAYSAYSPKLIPCHNDYDCDETTDKCCYDNCLKQKVCKTANFEKIYH